MNFFAEFSNKLEDFIIIFKWNFVCSNERNKSLYSTLYFAGYFAVVIIGLLADKFGRKFIAYILLVLNSISNILIAIIINVEMNEKAQQVCYGALRLAVGITANVYVVAMVSG